MTGNVSIERDETVIGNNSLEDEVNIEVEHIQDEIDIDSIDESNVQPTLKFCVYSGPQEPCEGMQFDELEDAETCYKAYSRQKGFSMRKSHTRLSRKDKSLIGVDYTCSREGFRQKDCQKKDAKGAKHAETRIGCKTVMSLKKVEDKWVVSKFVDKHNYELLTPRSTSFLRGHRKITTAQKNLINTLNEAGVPTRKIVSVLSQESGGHYNIGCTSVDVQNYIGNKRKKVLEEGDAQRLYRYFKECETKVPGFLYAVQVNENGCMGNCFWTDARSRMAYQCFGDVVTFDATYLTNRYGMPFVPFTGVNHHHQSIMFGCALLVNETAESYIWLLTTWLEAMLGRAPTTIITDDDKAMAKAIAQVLPNTTHRLCMWHILQKLPEHLAHIYNRYPLFQEELHHCIHDTITIEEFELEWNEIICKYGLIKNNWLQDLYVRREKWVPAFLRTTFCAGMSTTQRSESMNKFFKDFVRSSTLVSDFVYQYEKALNARCVKEKEKDVKTMNSKAILKTGYYIEAAAAKTYTRKMFLKFQQELFSSQNLKIDKLGENAGEKIYRVMPYGKETPAYEVAFTKANNKALCSCHMFEFVGILCRHIFAVFVKKSLVEALDPQYVLERWTMNVKKGFVDGTFGDVIQVERQTSVISMRNSLMVQFLEVAEHGLRSLRKYEHLSVTLQKVKEELFSMSDGENDIILDDGDLQGITQSQINHLLTNITPTLKDPLHVPTKGRPKSLRQKNPKENHSVGRKKCSVCKKPGHTKTTCPITKELREDTSITLTMTDATTFNRENNLEEESHPTSLTHLTPSFTMSQNSHPHSYTDLMREQHLNAYGQH